jgi:hypothetical protein
MSNNKSWLTGQRNEAAISIANVYSAQNNV